MKKKLALIILSAITAICCVVALAACGGTNHTHSYVSSVTTAATCTEDGVMTYTCSCGDSYTEVISAKGHTPAEAVKENEVAATCTEDGSYESVIYCSVCKAEISRETKTEKATGHTEVTDAAVAATCTESGLTEGSHCSVCGKVLIAQTAVSALGHDTIDHEAKAPTCTAVGWEAYQTCSRCDYSTYQEIPITEHTYGDAEWTWAEDYSLATATVTCSACGDKQSATDSKPIYTIETSATATAEGVGKYTATVTLNGNSYSDSQTVAIPILEPEHAHSYDDGTVTKEATCTAAGIITYTCSCGYSYTESIPATGHDYAFSSWNWSEDCSSAEAVFACQNDSEHTTQKTATITAKIEKAATTTGEGEIVYTASVAYGGRDYSDTKQVIVPTIIEYELSANNAYYTVVGLNDTSVTELEIPSEYNGKPVTAIGANAFYGNTIITSVTINVETTVIGENAFRGCTNLKSVTVGSGVANVGENAFCGCANLAKINYTGEISDWCGITFENADSNPLNAGHNLYISDTKVENLEIPSGVTEIKPFAFAGVITVKIVINITVIKVGESAFENCAVSESVTIGKGVTSVGENAFKGATVSEGVYYDGEISDWCGITFENADSNPLNAGHNLYISDTKVENLEIPSGVTEIKPFAFAGAVFVTIEINVTVVIIGDNAFVSCTVESVSFTGVESVWENVSVNTNSGNGILAGIACHTHSYTSSVTKSATCTEAGVMTYTCSCGDSYTETISAKGHTPAEAVKENEVAATCTEDGSYESVVYCSVCKAEISRETKTVTATGHTWNDGKVTTEATCTATGVNTFTCSVCGETKTEVISAKGHTPADAVEENEVAATCTTDGSYDSVVYCSVCKAEISRETKTVAAGHTWNDGEVTTEATCTATGVKTYTCTICKATKTETIATSGHNYVNGVCTVCGETKKVSENLAYTLSSDGTYYTISGIGDCTDKDIVIPETYNGLPVMAIAAKAFKNKTQITSVYIPDSVTSIGYGAFSGCTSLTSINIPNSVTSIGGYAFYNCTSLESVTIGNSVTSIGSAAFENCASLTSVTIGNSVTSIGDWAFEYCTSLTSINIPDSVTSIGYGAFSGCTSLTSINIPNSVTSIGGYAFYNCTSLTSINIPDSVTSIGSSAFRECAALNYNEYDNAYYLGNTTNPYVVLIKAKDTSITSCKINENTKVIYSSAFSGCSDLISINIPDSVTSIGSLAFEDCTSLESVTIGNSVTSIGSFAFEYCTSLTSINIPDSVTSIGNCAFSSCTSLTSINIPDRVTSIGDWAFSNCTSLESVTIGNSVTSIGDWAFYYCTSLTSINIPDSVTSIGSNAFYNCRSLESITIPDSVTSIGNGAFYECTALNYNEYDNAYYLGNATNPYVVLIKAKDTSITSCKINENTKIIYDCAFYNCTSLKSINIPDSVTSIGDNVFDNCASLTSINIPDSVTSIGDSAFSYCTSLTSINIPDSVTSIGDSAFSYCTSLTSITIPNGVTSIGSWAFYNCASLTSINIPDSVTSIGSYAFCDCTSLTSMTFKNTSGWFFSSSSDETSGTSISSDDLANASTAATYLTSTYCPYYWKRSES